MGRNRHVMYYQEGMEPGIGEWETVPFPGPEQNLREGQGVRTEGATYWGPNLRRCTCGHSRREHRSKTYIGPKYRKDGVQTKAGLIRYRGECMDTDTSTEGDGCPCTWFLERWDQRRTLPKPKAEPKQQSASTRNRKPLITPVEHRPSYYDKIKW